MQYFRALIKSMFGLAPDSPVAANEFLVTEKRTVTIDGFKVELDLSSQVLAVEAPIDRDFAFVRDVESESAVAPLSATIGPIDSTALVSASVLAQKAKIFDDGLYAAVEVATQDGAGRHAGKAALLASLGRALAGADPSVAGAAQKLLLGAARLGHVPVEGVPSDVEAGAQHAADEQLASAAKLLTELFDVTATKDWANCRAVADVEIDGQVLIGGAPVPFLLFLEKQISDLHSLVDKLPTLDEAEDWAKHDGAGLFKTAPIATHRTKKVQKPIVLYDATKEHPAQTQLITEDVVVGYWDTVKHSGALPAPRKKELMSRIEKLSQAVKFAREKANAADAERVSVGKPIFDYLRQ
jgi:hypothetical protein